MEGSQKKDNTFVGLMKYTRQKKRHVKRKNRSREKMTENNIFNQNVADHTRKI